MTAHPIPVPSAPTSAPVRRELPVLGGNLLTDSRMRTQRRCSREQHLRYEVGVVPVHDDSAPQRFGSLMHKALEAWWCAVRDGEEPLTAAIFAITKENAEPYESAKARALTVGYHARWSDEISRYEVLGVESELTPVPILNPTTGAASRTWLIGGKLDVYVHEIATGRKLVVEHKTTSDLGDDYFKRLRMDSQVSTYTTATDVEAVLYDVIAKPAQRPCGVPLVDGDGVKIVLDGAGERVRTKDGKKWRESGDAAQGYALQTRPETPEEYFHRIIDAIEKDVTTWFARVEIVRFDDEILEHQADTWATARTIRDNQLAQRWPRNPDACKRFGGMCGYFALCTGEASIEDASLFVRVGTGHRELSATT